MTAETTEWTVRRILDWTIGYLKEHGSDSPRREAEVLLAHACGWPRIQLYARFEEVLSPDVRARMRELVKRRGAAEPVAYLVGYREFFSLKFDVGPGVFIPRPDTETLVLESLEILKSVSGTPRVLDLCTGSGCVGISIAVNAPTAQVTCVELNDAPFAMSTRNAEKHQVASRLNVVQGNLFEPVSAGIQFHVIASNPPYITSGEIAGLDPDVVKYEPHAALDGGPDGLDVIREIMQEAPRRLVPGGWILFEISPEQAPATEQILAGAGLVQVSSVRDLNGQIRVVKGQRPEH